MLYYIGIMVEAFPVYLWICGFRESGKPCRKDIILVLFYGLCCLWGIQHGGLPMVVGPMTVWLMGMLLTEGSFSDRFLKCSLLYLSIDAIQLVFLFIFFIFGIRYNATQAQSHIAGLAVELLTIPVCAILLYYLRKKGFLHRLLQLGRLPRAIIQNTGLLMTLSAIYFRIVKNGLYSGIYSFLLLVVILMLFNMLSIYYDEKLTYRIRKDNQEIASYKKNYELYAALLDEIRTSQQDFMKRLQDLDCLPDCCEDYPTLAAAIRTQAGEGHRSSKIYPVLRYDLPLLAATLYRMEQMAAEQEIDIEYHIGELDKEQGAPEYEFADLCSILVQNALEETKTIGQRRVLVKLTTQEGKKYLQVKNPVAREYSYEELGSFFEKGKTGKKATKEDGQEHGYGLYYLKHRVEGLNGWVSADCVEQEGSFWISMSISV